MSIASARSRGSRGGRYRTVAYQSEVDESLFGDKSARPGSGNAAAVSRSEILRLTGRNLASSAAPAAVIGASEIDRMKTTSIIKTEADIADDRKRARAVQDAKNEKARRRKERMMQLEEERKKHVPLSVLEQEEVDQKERIRSRANFLFDEQLDDVKTMNAYAQYAKTVTIRDQQRRDKERIEAEAAAAEKVRDLEMEIARLETMKRHQEREQSLRKELVNARKHIEVQMEEHKVQMEAEREAVRREQEELKEQMKEQARVAEIEAAERARKQELMRQEIARANEEAIANKHRRRQAEVEEDQKMIEYQKRVAEEKAAQEKAAEEARQAREMEFAKMRAAQKKTLDNRGAIDELRARRAFEAGERAARQKAAAEARKRREDLENLARVREEQRQHKEEQMAALIAQEQEEFERIKKVQEETAQREREEDEKKRRENLKHKDELLTMIQEREKQAKKEREELLSLSTVDTAEREAYLERVRRIRERKVQELIDAGVDPKYTVQLAKHDPMKNILKDYKLGAKVPAPGS